VTSADRHGGCDGTAHRLDRLAVDRDEHIHGGAPRVKRQRPALRIRVGRVGVHLLARLVKGVGAWIRLAGEDGPHREQRVEYEDRLGGDDEKVREEVASVRRREKKHRVGQDSDGRDDHEEGHHGRAFRRVGVRSGGIVDLQARNQGCHEVSKAWHLVAVRDGRWSCGKRRRRCLGRGGEASLGRAAGLERHIKPNAWRSHLLPRR